MKLTTEYYMSEEFWNLPEEDSILALDCIFSNIRADILMLIMQYEEELDLYQKWQDFKKANKKLDVLNNIQLFMIFNERMKIK